MIKEIKYIMYLVTIFIFFFMSGKYYFSDEFNKKFYRTLNNHQSKIDKFSKNLIILNSDTENIIEYIDNDRNKLEKKYQFWKLLDND
tara:strand:+ start:1874 stop:2134 length:261 start_codon:yes stop_codon:yes gene_type:complete